MEKKIATFREILKKFSPYTITLISGSFDPFNEYYFKLLLWASRLNRPLIVIAQKDDMVMTRRGFTALSLTHRIRAKILSALEFIDYVIVANKTAHDKRLIELLRPKIIALQNDNLAYRKSISQNTTGLDPNIQVKIAPFRPIDFSKSSDNVPADWIKGRIAQKLLTLSRQCKNAVSKISAILADNKNRVLLKSENSIEGEHAEILLLQKAQQKKLGGPKCILYVLIPPCIMCAKVIANHQIKKVFYLLPYGDMKGASYLLKRGIEVKNFK